MLYKRKSSPCGQLEAVAVLEKDKNLQYRPVEGCKELFEPIRLERISYLFVNSFTFLRTESEGSAEEHRGRRELSRYLRNVQSIFEPTLR